MVIDSDEPKTVEALLQYFYMGNLQDSSEIRALLPLAHRLDAIELVEHCCEVIMEELTPDNVCASVAAMLAER